MPQNYKKSGLLLVILLCVLPTFAQSNQKRTALVIGNSSYPSPNNLTNPSADATDMVSALTELGFEVIQGVNPNKQQLENLIDNFGKNLAENKGLGLVYYSGLGFQS